MRRKYYVIAAIIAVLMLFSFPVFAEPNLGNLPTGEPVQLYSTQTGFPSPGEYDGKNIKMVLDTTKRAIQQFGEENGVTPSNPLSQIEYQCLTWRLDMYRRKLIYGFWSVLGASQVALAEANYNYAKLMTEFWCNNGRGGRGLGIFDSYLRECEDQMVEDLTRERTNQYWVMAKLGFSIIVHTEANKMKEFPENLKSALAKAERDRQEPGKPDAAIKTGVTAALVALGIAFSLAVP